MKFDQAQEKYDLERATNYYQENNESRWATNCEIEKHFDDLGITIWCKLDVQIHGDEIINYDIDIIEIRHEDCIGDFSPYNKGRTQYEVIIDSEMLDENIEYFMEAIYD